MNFLTVTVEKIEGETITVRNPRLDPVAVPSRGRSFQRGETAILGVRPQYLDPPMPRPPCSTAPSC